MEQELLNLERRINELVLWKEMRVKDRLVNPLDAISQKLIQTSALNIITSKGVLSTVVNNIVTYRPFFRLKVNLNGKNYFVWASFPLRPFTAVPSTFTNTNGQHNLKANDSTLLATTNTLPTGLDSNTVYYIINPTATTFQLSTTAGGSAVVITDSGVGTHYYVSFNP